MQIWCGTIAVAFAFDTIDGCWKVNRSKFLLPLFEKLFFGEWLKLLISLGEKYFNWCLVRKTSLSRVHGDAFLFAAGVINSKNNATMLKENC